MVIKIWIIILRGILWLLPVVCLCCTAVLEIRKPSVRWCKRKCRN